MVVSDTIVCVEAVPVETSEVVTPVSEAETKKNKSKINWCNEISIEINCNQGKLLVHNNLLVLEPDAVDPVVIDRVDSVGIVTLVSELSISVVPDTVLTVGDDAIVPVTLEMVVSDTISGNNKSYTS